MKPTKKQIEEVTKLAEENNVDLQKAISTLSNCSLSIYKAIGAAGVVASAKESSRILEADNSGGILFDRCSIVGFTEKAYLLATPSETEHAEVWVAKSVIKDGIVPFWAIK